MCFLKTTPVASIIDIGFSYDSLKNTQNHNSLLCQLIQVFTFPEGLPLAVPKVFWKDMLLIYHISFDKGGLRNGIGGGCYGW